MCMCKCLLLTDNLQFYTTNWFKIFWEYSISGVFLYT